MICQPVVNLALIVELFPSVHPKTVARWNRKTAGRGRRLPGPSLVVGGVELWTVEAVLSWAQLHGLSVDRVTLDRVLRDQTT